MNKMFIFQSSVKGFHFMKQLMIKKIQLVDAALQEAPDSKHLENRTQPTSPESSLSLSLIISLETPTEKNLLLAMDNDLAQIHTPSCQSSRMNCSVRAFL